MDISKIVYKIYDESIRHGQTVALCSVYFDRVFVIHNTFILQNADGSLVVMCPYYHDNKGNKVEKNMYHPTNKAFRRYFDATVLKGYFTCKEQESSCYYPTDSFIKD